MTGHFFQIDRYALCKDVITKDIVMQKANGEKIYAFHRKRSNDAKECATHLLPRGLSPRIKTKIKIFTTGVNTASERGGSWSCAESLVI